MGSTQDRSTEQDDDRQRRRGGVADDIPKAVSLVNERDATTPAGPRRLSRAVWSLSIALALVAGSAVGGAQAEDGDARRDRVNSQLDASRGRLANLSAKSQEAVLALQRTQANLAAAQSVLADAQAREATALARKARIEADLVVAQKEEAAGLARLIAIRAAQVRTTDLRNNIARQAYEGSGLERLAAVLNTDKAQDLADNMYVVEKVNDSQNAVLVQLAADKAKADAEQARLAETRRRIAGLRLQAEAAVRTAADARSLADATRAQLVSLQSRQRAAAAAVAAQRGEEAARVAALQAESARIERQLAAAAAAAARNGGGGGSRRGGWTSGNGQFAIPVAGPLTSGFEWRVNPILGTRELHSGLDIGADCGTPVHASGNGQIINAGPIGGYGNSIWIDHGGGIVTTYNHMQAFARTSGGVSRGDVIGYVGTTGLSTGCHMHWEVRVNGVPVDPNGWF